MRKQIDPIGNRKLAFIYATSRERYLPNRIKALVEQFLRCDHYALRHNKYVVRPYVDYYRSSDKRLSSDVKKMINAVEQENVKYVIVSGPEKLSESATCIKTIESMLNKRNCKLIVLKTLTDRQRDQMMELTTYFTIKALDEIKKEGLYQ